MKRNRQRTFLGGVFLSFFKSDISGVRFGRTGQVNNNLSQSLLAFGST
jgi:hypothetical protein